MVFQLHCPGPHAFMWICLDLQNATLNVHQSASDKIFEIVIKASTDGDDNGMRYTDTEIIKLMLENG